MGLGAARLVVQLPVGFGNGVGIQETVGAGLSVLSASRRLTGLRYCVLEQRHDPCNSSPKQKSRPTYGR